MLKQEFSEELFSKMPLVGILRGYSKSIILKIIAAYHEAGYSNIEVTMNTPDVAEIVAEVVSRYGAVLNVGVGTVCTMDDLNTAIKAGAQYIVCPIVDIEIIRECKRRGVPVFPGAYSPTEIYQAWVAGARMVKVFPASQFGPQYIKEVLGPLNNIELMPTGGVSLDNIPIYKEIGVTAFGVGSLLFDKQLIKDENWSGLVSHLIEVKNKIEQM